MENKPTPRGRGALLEQMRKRKEDMERLQVEVAPEPQKARGRASILQKLKIEKERQLGFASTSKTDTKEEKAVGAEEEAAKLEEQDYEEGMEQLAIADPCRFQGTSGRPIRVATNFIRLTIEPDKGIFEYEVRFSPDVDAKSNRISLVNQALGEMNTTKVFDGANCLYLPIKWHAGERTYDLTLPTNPNQTVKTCIKYKRQKRFSDPQVLHLYNVLFNRIMNILLFTRMGRNYFSPDHKHLIPQHKLEVYPGYAVSVEERESGLMVCLDTQHRVIRNQTVYQLLQDIRCSNPLDIKDLARQSLLGAVVLTKYNNRTYKVDDIAWDMTPMSTFKNNKGEDIPFVDYYKNNYRLTIHDRDQPLLIHRRSVTVENQKVDNIICLIPELCYLTGLTDVMRADFKVMKDVAAFTRITPHQRMLALRSYLDKVNNSEQCNKILSAWGLKLTAIATDIGGRQLEDEEIWFGDETFVKGADWNMAIAKHKVRGPIDLVNWIVFFTPRDRNYAENFADTMMRCGRTLGCIVQRPQLVLLRDARTETYVNACNTNITPSVQVVVFIFPTVRVDLYSAIKRISCTQLPCASQVILSKTLANPKKTQSIIAKVALQINCKLGGILWNVKIPATGWMVCGIDAYHSTKQSSVCGFVASINQSFTRWFSDVVFQEGEIGNSYKVAFKKALEVYKRECGNFPKFVVVYRDGTGDGQLDSVKRYEVLQFEQVINDLGLDIKITFIVVQKRISTRIFQIKGTGQMDNPPAGTIVDHSITKTCYYDFYLVPQTVRQGTVNPTHYIVLQNDADIKADHLQRFTYKLCHLYYNWCGTIRVPAPCQYAHKLAGLVGQYIQKKPHSELSNRLYYL